MLDIECHWNFKFKYMNFSWLCCSSLQFSCMSVSAVARDGPCQGPGQEYYSYNNFVEIDDSSS